MIPPYMDGNVDRQTRIDFIVTKVQAALAPYSVDVVTTRPASGDYLMVVLGGSATQLGFSNIGGVASQPCSAAKPNLVSLEFDNVYLGIPQSSLVLSDIGQMIGMGLTTDTNDCANRTEDWTSICTYGAMATAAVDSRPPATRVTGRCCGALHARAVEPACTKLTTSRAGGSRTRRPADR